jgi:predicted porin
VVSDRAAESCLSQSSGIQSGSRLGFKGSEDLGNNMNVSFVLENGFNADAGGLAQGGLLFGRRATVGLSGNFGAFNLGRRNTPYFNTMDSVDPMSTGFAGNATNLFATTGVRMNNAMIFTTQNFRGFTGEIAYGLGEVAGSNSANRQIGSSIAYVDGPISVSLAHHRAENQTATDTAKNTVIAGKYTFENIATAHLAYAHNDGTGALESDDLLVGATVPFGPHTIMLSFIRKNDKSTADADAKQYAVAYTYALSKRTNLYVSYAKISNENSAAYKTNNGFGDREANFGIRHKF